MKSFKILVALICVAMTTSCSEQLKETSNLNFITFQEKEVYFNIDSETTSEIKVLVNTTNKVGSKRTVKLSPKEGQEFTTVELDKFTIPEYVEIPANSNEGEFIITSKQGVDFGPLDKITLSFVETDFLFEGDLTVRMRELCDLNPLILNIQFDDIPSETSWTLKGQGQTWMSGQGDDEGPSSTVEFSCLADGIYNLEVDDSFGDGFLQGGGTIALTLGYDNQPFMVKVDFEGLTYKYDFEIKDGVATQL